MRSASGILRNCQRGMPSTGVGTARLAGEAPFDMDGAAQIFMLCYQADSFPSPTKSSCIKAKMC